MKQQVYLALIGTTFAQNEPQYLYTKEAGRCTDADDLDHLHRSIELYYTEQDCKAYCSKMEWCGAAEFSNPMYDPPYTNPKTCSLYPEFSFTNYYGDNYKDVTCSIRHENPNWISPQTNDAETEFWFTKEAGSCVRKTDGKYDQMLETYAQVESEDQCKDLCASNNTCVAGWFWGSTCRMLEEDPTSPYVGFGYMGPGYSCFLKTYTQPEQTNELTEMLDVSMSRWGQRRVGQKGEAVGKAWQDMTRGPRNEEEEAQMMRELNDLSMEVTGRSLQDFDKLANSRGEKYENAIRAIGNSQSWNDMARFEAEKIPRDRLAQKIYQDVQTVHKDLFGAYNSQYQYWERPTYRFDEIRTRPENDDNMSRMERDQADIEGAHIDNDDLKDIAEDVEDIFNDFNDFMNPNYGLQQEAIKLDAKIRFSPEMAALGALIKEDLATFDITDEESFERNVGDAMMKLERRAENCPFIQRLEKTCDRFIRAACKEVRVADLPTGQRMQWVNELTQELYEIMQMGDPVSGVEDFVDDVLEDVFHQIARYMQTVDRMEMEFGKDM